MCHFWAKAFNCHNGPVPFSSSATVTRSYRVPDGVTTRCLNLRPPGPLRDYVEQTPHSPGCICTLRREYKPPRFQSEHVTTAKTRLSRLKHLLKIEANWPSLPLSSLILLRTIKAINTRLMLPIVLSDALRGKPSPAPRSHDTLPASARALTTLHRNSLRMLSFPLDCKCQKPPLFPSEESERNTPEEG